jgi:hypothetical protein
MWRRVDLVNWTDVSEERIASIFRVEKCASQEPAWAGGFRLSHYKLVIVVGQFNVAFMCTIYPNRPADQTTFQLSNMASTSRTIVIFVIDNIQEMVRAEFVHVHNLSSYRILLRQT